ncbi:hypothetical protein L873DRAFT_1807760 [Choiromyces venosus 120613-1]|uniref:BTB domain-containing protein n=1 Tax=Choiromyces venosus 120613-1 TaxID=1336337 RepID=A0A3N4JPJ0_9PEZI|nr:hypothetical protein L873DRAFT_1807760 [Choiromyces venosus 120613-1]
MEEWDAETISRMIDYLYTGDYTWQMDGKFKPIPIEGPGETPIAEISKFVEGRPLTPLQEFKRYSSTSSMSYDAWSSFHGTEQGFEKLLLIHAKVYALAHYRAIEKLSKLALDRLMQTLLLLQPGEFNLQKIGCIVELVAYVYENTCLRLGKPEAMRQAVTRFIGLEITRLNPKGEISKLMGTYGDFADDLLADLIRRIKFSEVNCVIKHKYIAGIEVHVGYPQPPNCMQEYHWGSPNINEWKSCESVPVWKGMTTDFESPRLPGPPNPHA